MTWRTALAHGKPGTFGTTAAPERVLAAAEDAGWQAGWLRTTANTDKPELMDALAAALQLPPWFGRNWDALADCLGDLRHEPGTLLVWSGGDELAPELAEALDDVLHTRVEDGPLPFVLVRTQAPARRTR